MHPLPPQALILNLSGHSLVRSVDVAQVGREPSTPKALGPVPVLHTAGAVVNTRHPALRKQSKKDQ